MEKHWNKNQIHLQGTVCQNPCYSHSSHGTDYYLFPFAVQRLSGAVDKVKILAEKSLQCGICCGDTLCIIGEVRSYNNHQGTGRRLIITVHAHCIEKKENKQEEDENFLELAGTLCKAPIYRRTPLGRDICDMMLAVNRSYGRCDYLPCIAWGALAQRCGELTVGTPLVLEGRLQSRVYTKKLDHCCEERTAFEISISQMELYEESEPCCCPSGQDCSCHKHCTK